jgi:lysophospholipase L1-like esterase
MFAPDRSAFRTCAGGIALALTLVIAGSGCSSGDTSAVELMDPDGTNNRSVVVALGDSITFGVLDTNVEVCDESTRGAGGFCPPLEAISGKTVINAGVCGEDSFGGAERINRSLQRWRPGVILLDYSPNDLNNGPQANINNLRIMVDAARNNRTVPIIGTLLPAAGDHSGWNSHIDAVNTLILDLCAEQGLECADLHRAFRNDPDFMNSPFALLSEDGLHPNHAGYVLMAETWARSLRRVY